MKSSDHIIRPDVVCGEDDVMGPSRCRTFSGLLIICFCLYYPLTLFLGNQVKLLNISELQCTDNGLLRLRHANW